MEIILKLRNEAKQFSVSFLEPFPLSNQESTKIEYSVFCIFPNRPSRSFLLKKLKTEQVKDHFWSKKSREFTCKWLSRSSLDACTRNPEIRPLPRSFWATQAIPLKPDFLSAWSKYLKEEWCWSHSLEFHKIRLCPIQFLHQITFSFFYHLDKSEN